MFIPLQSTFMHTECHVIWITQFPSINVIVQLLFSNLMNFCRSEVQKFFDYLVSSMANKTVVGNLVHRWTKEVTREVYKWYEILQMLQILCHPTNKMILRCFATKALKHHLYAWNSSPLYAWNTSPLYAWNTSQFYE